MPGTIQPLDQQFSIVDNQGRPTLYFIKWAQQRQIDITDGISLQDLIDYLTAHMLQEGSGIQITPDGAIPNMPEIAADVQEILDQVTATRGAILYRGLLGWSALLPGTAGFFLQSAGAGADPLWAAGGGGGGTYDGLGANVVIDPGFDDPTKWIVSGGWSISGSNAVGTSAGNSLRQNGVLVPGTTYRIAFPWTKTGGTNLRLVGGGGTTYLIQSVAGSSGTFYGTFPSHDTDFLIQADSLVFTGTISQISIKPLIVNF